MNEKKKTQEKHFRRIDEQCNAQYEGYEDMVYIEKQRETARTQLNFEQYDALLHRIFLSFRLQLHKPFKHHFQKSTTNE